MLTGGHVVIYSTDAEADRAFFRDVLEMPNVDVGGGWLIFGLPPSEVAFHPGEKNGTHEFYFMTADLDAFIAKMKAKSVEVGEIESPPWGTLTHITLPGGGKLGVYQPRHGRPESMPA